MHSLASLWLLPALLCISLLSSARGNEPHQSTADVKKELSQTVDSQLAAFRDNDFAKAYGFASSEIQSLYSAEAFEGMVKSSYPVIAHSSSAEYGDALDTGDDALLDVHVVSASQKRDGQFRYRLHKQDGKWRITGVLEIKPTGMTV